MILLPFTVYFSSCCYLTSLHLILSNVSMMEKIPTLLRMEP